MHCGQQYHHYGMDGQPGTQQLITPDNEGKTPYSLLLSLSNALMTITISLPVVDHLDSIPIINIAPNRIWVPSEYNGNHPGLSFNDLQFLAQTVQTEPCPPSPGDDVDPETFHDTTKYATNDPILHDVPSKHPFPMGGNSLTPPTPSLASPLLDMPSTLPSTGQPQSPPPPSTISSWISLMRN